MEVNFKNIQSMFQNFKSPLPHVNGVKCIVNIKQSCKLWQESNTYSSYHILVTFEIMIIFQNKMENLVKSMHLKFSYFF
jgi:hypothetical protein